MKIGAPKEIFAGEKRVALTPESAKRLQKLGYECLVEAGAGEAASLTDEAYRDAGVTVVGSAAELWDQADIIVKVRGPSDEEVEAAPEGKLLSELAVPAPEVTGVAISGATMFVTEASTGSVYKLPVPTGY